MDNERAKYMGYLAQYEETARRIETTLKGLVTSMRNLLDPLEAVADLKTDLIFQQASQLAYQQGELKAVTDQIREAKRILGR